MGGKTGFAGHGAFSYFLLYPYIFSGWKPVCLMYSIAGTDHFLMLREKLHRNPGMGPKLDPLLERLPI